MFVDPFAAGEGLYNRGQTHDTLCILEEISSRDPTHPSIAMLKADENIIDELTSMSSSSNQHCNGRGGALAVKGSSFRTGKASFTAKLIMCPNEFCPRL